MLEPILSFALPWTCHNTTQHPRSCTHSTRKFALINLSIYMSVFYLSERFFCLVAFLYHGWVNFSAMGMLVDFNTSMSQVNPSIHSSSNFTQHGSSISNSWLYIQSSLFRLFTVVCVKDLARQPNQEIRAESPSRIYVDAQVVHCSEIILAMLPHSLAIVMHQRTRYARLHRH
jgi:hypothetical protein